MDENNIDTSHDTYDNNGHLKADVNGQPEKSVKKHWSKKKKQWFKVLIGVVLSWLSYLYTNHLVDNIASLTFSQKVQVLLLAPATAALMYVTFMYAFRLIFTDIYD